MGTIPSNDRPVRALLIDDDREDYLLTKDLFGDIPGGRFTRAGLIRILPRVRRGTHLGHALVTAHQARTVSLDAPGITAYADGERVGPLPLTVTCVPGALTLLTENGS